MTSVNIIFVPVIPAPGNKAKSRWRPLNDVRRSTCTKKCYRTSFLISFGSRVLLFHRTDSRRRTSSSNRLSRANSRNRNSRLTSLKGTLGRWVIILGYPARLCKVKVIGTVLPVMFCQREHRTRGMTSNGWYCTPCNVLST